MPKLAKYPPSALIFRLKAQTMGANFDYSDITDQAWEGLAAGQLNQDIMQIRIVLDKQKVAEIEKKLNPVQAVESTGLCECVGWRSESGSSHIGKRKGC